jgi:class 3 adenylate cyclase
LFADIKGSMELMKDLGPKEARAIVGSALQLIIEAAHRNGGYIVQLTGDRNFRLVRRIILERGPSPASALRCPVDPAATGLAAIAVQPLAAPSH